MKVADFGMARYYGDPPPKLTQLVVTLWYRAPELLLGAENYGPEIDLWSVGCIFGELLKKEPLLQGKNEVDQLSKVCPLSPIFYDGATIPNTFTRFLNSVASRRKRSGRASSASRMPKLSACHATPPPQVQSSAPSFPSSPPPATSCWRLFYRSTPPIGRPRPKCSSTRTSRKLQSPNQQPCSQLSHPRQGKKRDGDLLARMHQCEAMRLRSRVRGRIFEGYSEGRVWKRAGRDFN